jgi:hypothetical protein
VNQNSSTAAIFQAPKRKVAKIQNGAEKKRSRVLWCAALGQKNKLAVQGEQCCLVPFVRTSSSTSDSLSGAEKEGQFGGGANCQPIRGQLRDGANRQPILLPIAGVAWMSPFTPSECERTRNCCGVSILIRIGACLFARSSFPFVGQVDVSIPVVTGIK